MPHTVRICGVTALVGLLVTFGSTTPAADPPEQAIAKLLKIVRETPGLKLVLLNAARTIKGETLADLTAAGNVSVEIAVQEGVNGVETLLKSAPIERVLFGSLSPLFYFEAALLKLQESPLAAPQVRAICESNARRLLAEA